MKKSTKRTNFSSKLLKQLAEEEESNLYEADDSIVPPDDIVVFNELRSCADLMRMYESNQLTVDPDFQRDVVWKNPAQTRFIDSLVKELPIPSMCISFDHQRKERLVVDGLQRMSTIIKFLDQNRSWKLSTLSDIDSRISGRTNIYIRENYDTIYDTVENLTLPVTVLRCDYGKPEHMRYLFMIFHRLNTGGSKLSNQEVRNCIFSGTLNALLRTCVLNPDFRHLLSLKENESYRFAYEELVLRFFAFTDGYTNYDGKLSAYLNEYMNSHRNPQEAFLKKKLAQFEGTISVLYQKAMDGVALPSFGKATTEAVLVGIGRNLKRMQASTASDVRDRLERLLSEPEFQPENLKNALTTKEKMKARLKRSEQIFGK